ncbi:hypothetical protein M2366_003654 [Aeromonas sp. BIGb0405]|uniref:T6SS phospholipase effector Tle1-like catalytic domain-containing protein n=1 Tax=unclassified Aeromonas TaxID=257493 RepID=UPI0021689143|nr:MULTISPECIES: DUF2235 domain-containing protein [unclassified Aeromonas]MCS3457538.1 hypothetical protein [Aeromonas sp. BIGb0405]MCS3461540.1 hypothetical protein [Aeromonas sp. BIGb0445]
MDNPTFAVPGLGYVLAPITAPLALLNPFEGDPYQHHGKVVHFYRSHIRYRAPKLPGQGGSRGDRDQMQDYRPLPKQVKLYLVPALARQEKAELQEREQAAEQRKEVKGLFPAGDVPLKVASQANDMTNIGKAHVLYDISTTGVLSVPVYIDGIGTENGEGDTGAGQGADTGSTSSLAKVEQACKTKIVEELKLQLGPTLNTIDCIHKIDFDVFGFSRGASAARQFVNIIDQQAEHLLAEAVGSENAIRLKAGFDWASREDCRIKFVGLFDTVTTSAKKRHVTLSPDCAERVVHLIAADEWRYFFALTRISDDIAGANIAPNFTEVIIPGSHSDVGGGYYSRWSLSNPNSDPAITEQIAIKVCRSEESSMFFDPKKSRAYQRAKLYAEEQVIKGWGNEVVDLPNVASAPVRNKLSLRVRVRRHPKTDKMSVEVEVLLNRVVEGEYSRIPLHMMVVAAQDVGVPFREWDHADRALMLDSGASKPPLVNLTKIDSLWLDAAKERGVVKNLAQTLKDDFYRQLRFSYLHHSADTGLVNTPHHHRGKEARHIYTNQEGG